MMKSYVVCALLALVSAKKDQTSEIQMQAYMAYLAKYGKSYNHVEEFNQRIAFWKRTDAFITDWSDNHISKHSDWSPNLKHTHTVAHNKFSDWSDIEMKALLV